MSIVLNVAHGFNTKKLTVSKGLTGSQLTQLAVEKFGLSGSGTGQLSHNNKPIENSLPLRLTSLTNNSKLKLEIHDNLQLDSFAVNIKLLVDINGESRTFIEKIDCQLSLLAVLNKFESIHSINISKNHIQLIMFNQVYTDLQATLGSIIGDTNNLVIRVKYTNPNNNINHEQEQEKINQLQLKNQHDRNMKLKLEREQQQELHRLEQARVEAALKEPQVQDSPEIVNPIPLHRDNRQQELEDHLTQQQELELGDEPPEPAPTPIQPVHYSYEAPKMEETPRLYKPAAATRYENPDDDYNMSVNQLKTYQKIIQNSSKPASNKKLKTVPGKLLIRIKFPNQNILQINFINDLPNTKLGQLFKKIDELILPQFLNNYNLKFGYPPFKKIEMGFDSNNQKLIDLPDFMNESIVLIWETSAPSNGPFLKEDAINDIKLSSELPELVLEQHRGELPTDATNKNHHDGSIPENNGTNNPNNPNNPNNHAKSEVKRGVPKWFKSK